jgi:Domain of unknown function (DUF4286)
MIVYNITVNIDNDRAEDWLTWMRDVHIPDVMKTGCFLENRIFRVLADEDSGGKTYSVQYYCNSMKEFEQYESDFAAALRADHAQRYKDKFVAFRTFLEVIK